MLIKGGHLEEGPDVVDTLYADGEYTEFRHPRIADAEAHGTGCTLASAVAANLAVGLPLKEACRRAIDLVHDALSARYATGGSKQNYLWLKPWPL